jgi:hypothetical protein
MKRLVAVIVAALTILAAIGPETAVAKNPSGKSVRSFQGTRRQKSPGEAAYDHLKAGGKLHYNKPSKTARSVFDDSSMNSRNPSGLLHSTTALDRSALNPQPLPPGRGEMMQEMLR